MPVPGEPVLPGVQAAGMPGQTVQALLVHKQAADKRLVSAAVFLCGTLGLSEGNIVSLNVHAVVLDTVLVCIIAVAQTAFHNDHTALVEITADKLRLLSPAGNTNEISFPFAGLFVGKAPIHCHTDAADSDAALCLPEIRIRTKPSHQNHFIQHIVSLSEIGLTLR